MRDASDLEKLGYKATGGNGDGSTLYFVKDNKNFGAVFDEGAAQRGKAAIIHINPADGVAVLRMKRVTS